MNYIIEINSFYDWLETNPVSESCILLWHALMHVNNKTGWKQEFAVAISTLELKTSLSKSSILRARNTLQQLKRIKFTSREGQQSAVYEMIVFHTDTQPEAQPDTQSGTQPDTQSVPITKLKEKKLNKTSSPRGETKNLYWKKFIEVFEKFYLEQAQEKYVYLKKDWGCLNKIYQFLKKRAELKKHEWTEQVMTESFNFFLKKAWHKDEWLRKNFSIPNVLSQFNQITKESSNGSNTIKSGNAQNGSKHSAGANRLLEQFENNLKTIGGR